MRHLSPIAILLVAVTLVASACGGSDADKADEKPTVPAGAVAVVGDTTITKAEFDSLYASARAEAEELGAASPDALTADAIRLFRSMAGSEESTVQTMRQ
jgi:ABC-type glycerol-3-phosphate transport system substrate-binding protein